MSYAALAIVFGFVFLLLVLRAYFLLLKGEGEELHLHNESKVVFFSAVICVVVVVMFLFFRENSLEIPEGLGQVGDFIGGLTNPILSFAALIVLLRSSAIQTNVIKRQDENQVLENFRSEFYRLLDNIFKSSERMNKDEDYIDGLFDRFRNERAMLAELYTSSDVYEIRAEKCVLEAIKYKAFSRFALTIRMAMHHLVESNPKQMYRYATMIKDSMTDKERVVFLTWIYYGWPIARDWFREYVGESGQKHNYGYTEGLEAENFISDKVYKFFS
ncbi:hypothetical protein JET68_27900 [Pseudomonas monteilii]|uniref:hypothetical protein n=1 Tax=Pseudomonas monteilii TaxID=76759 RepID=UPI0018E6ABD7|nr:hypothetical protein [Pseudomonas monteilii]MBI6922619.1 hypothetical protein [Pseudomonas monteilii]